MAGLADSTGAKDRAFQRAVYCAAPPKPYSPVNTEVLSQDDLWFDLINHNWKSATKAEKDWAITLAPLFLGAGGAKLTMIDKTFSSNIPLLQDMVRNYEAYKTGEISKGQYDYRRAKLVGQFQSNLGPTTQILNPTRPQSEVLRISRRKGQVPTEALKQQISRLQTASKVASKGGLVLSVAGLGLACHQIAHTEDRKEKNEILVESSAGFVAGFFQCGFNIFPNHVHCRATAVGRCDFYFSDIAIQNFRRSHHSQVQNVQDRDFGVGNRTKYGLEFWGDMCFCFSHF